MKKSILNFMNLKSNVITITIIVLRTCLKKVFSIFFLFILENSYGATIKVGPPPVNIQSFVDKAIDGDTIQLSQGTYIGQICIISKSLNIVGCGQDKTIIQAPEADTPLTQYFNIGPNIWPIILIDNQNPSQTQNVNITNLTINGGDQQDTTRLSNSTGMYGVNDRYFAIGYHNAGGTIENVHTTNTRSRLNFDQVAGGGIVNVVDKGSANFIVNHCLIDFYQRNGIVCIGTHLIALISNNTINRGYFLQKNTETTPPSGITFGGLSTGKITNNNVHNNIATIANKPSIGINIPWSGQDLIVSDNLLANNDIGIKASQCGHNLSIENNTVIFQTLFGTNIVKGIIVQDTMGLTNLIGNILNVPNVLMELKNINGTNQPFQLINNQFIGGEIGLSIFGKSGKGGNGPFVLMNGDSFVKTKQYYIREMNFPYEALHDMWPTTVNVSFDGALPGLMTLAEYKKVRLKIFDKRNDPSLGLVLDYIEPVTPSEPQ